VKPTTDIGLDSQCLSFLIDAFMGVSAPSGALAAEKTALARIYLYTSGTLWVTPTVVSECARIRHQDRKSLHESWTSVLFGERSTRDPDAVHTRALQFQRFHRGYEDCRILAEAEDIEFDVLLSYDAEFLRHLRTQSLTVVLTEPTACWNALAIPKGSSPRKVPHSTNPLSSHEWWRW
jgi:hypothetical protein